jgi:hypothetical protein
VLRSWFVLLLINLICCSAATTDSGATIADLDFDEIEG